LNARVSTDVWQVADLDLEGYLARTGASARAPSIDALAELHEAHVRAFTFDNVDVLLRRHPGVSLAVVQSKFVVRGRGGYCFEHSTLFSAVLELLGYDVRRHLGRVGDPATGAVQARTHMTASVVLDGERWLCDPGFGMSLLRPIRLADGAEDDYLPGWRHRVRRTPDDAWALHRLRDAGWEVAHTVDELPVTPLDVVMGHHFTSTFPGSHFTTGLMVTQHQAGRHVTVTHDTLTIRVAGGPTEHRPLRDGELESWLTTLDARLTVAELAAVLDWDSARRRP
jgi:arylamine N-acetyltransferase